MLLLFNKNALKEVVKLKYIKIILAFVMAVIISVSSWISTFAYSNHQPRVSVITTVEAVPVGETFVCGFTIYSANGFPESFVPGNYCIEIKGTGKASLVSVDTTSNTGLTVSGRFTLKATYPGQISVTVKNDSFCDSIGIYNTGSVPQRVDIKIFNINGENAYEKMTDFEVYLTYFIAPFWSVFNSIKNLFN